MEAAVAHGPFKLRNRQDLDGLLQELTAIYPYEVLVQLYEEAVNDQPYSFLFINMKAPRERMFSISFDEILTVGGKDELEDENGRLPPPPGGQTAGRW